MVIAALVGRANEPGGLSELLCPALQAVDTLLHEAAHVEGPAGE